MEIAQAVENVGGTLVTSTPDPSSLSWLPGRVVLCPRLPHSKVIPLVGTVISGDGWGTTTKALAAGVPIAVIPHGLDTVNTARAVEEAGCGVRIDQPNAAVIAVAIERTLFDPTVKGAARALSEPDAPAEAVERAIPLIEAAAR